MDSSWRHPDLGGRVYRLRMRRRLVCPEHGVVTESVLFARPGARFTADFEDLVFTGPTQPDPRLRQGRRNHPQSSRTRTVSLPRSNGRHDGLNNKIRTMTRRAYGFHSPEAALCRAHLRTCGP